MLAAALRGLPTEAAQFSDQFLRLLAIGYELGNEGGRLVEPHHGRPPLGADLDQRRLEPVESLFELFARLLLCNPFCLRAGAQNGRLRRDSSARSKARFCFNLAATSAITFRTICSALREMEADRQRCVMAAATGPSWTKRL